MRCWLCVLPGVGVALAGCGAAAIPSARIETRTVAAPPVTVSSPVRVGRAPVAIAVGRRSVWVANTASGTVTRVDSATHRPVGHAIDVGAGPRALAADGDGVWVATAAGTVEHLDERPAAAPREPARVPDPAGVAVGDQVVWVSSRSTNTVRRLDARTGHALGAPIRVGQGPTDIALAAGSVWVANSLAGTVTRIDAQSAKVVGDPIRVAKAQVLALTAGQGGVWVAKTDQAEAQDITVEQISPGSGKLAGTSVAITGGIPTTLAAGAGYVWVTAPGSPLQAVHRPPGLLRIDPRRMARAGTPIEFGTQAQAVSVGPAGVWAADAATNTIVQVEPRKR